PLRPYATLFRSGHISARVGRLGMEVLAMLERSVGPKDMIGPLERDLLERLRPDEERKRRIARFEIEEMHRRPERVQRPLQLGIGMDAPRDHARPYPSVEIGQQRKILGNVADVLDVGIAKGAEQLRVHARKMLERILGAVEVAAGVERTG